jgi:hypothetical protein
MTSKLAGMRLFISMRPPLAKAASIPPGQPVHLPALMRSVSLFYSILHFYGAADFFAKFLIF